MRILKISRSNPLIRHGEQRCFRRLSGMWCMSNCYKFNSYVCNLFKGCTDF